MAVNNRFNNINNALFAQLEALDNTDNDGNLLPVDTERIKAVVGISTVLLKSAEVELQCIKARQDMENTSKEVQSTFLGSIGKEIQKPLLPHGEA